MRVAVTKHSAFHKHHQDYCIVITFEDSPWQEKQCPLRARFQCHLAFSQLLGRLQAMLTGRK